jgi:hypothetical protein
MISINVLFGTIVGFIATMPFIIELIKRSWNSYLDKPWPSFMLGKWKLTDRSARIMSWIVCVIFALVGMWFNLGVFGNFNYFQTVLIGLITAWSANGLYGTGYITVIANYLEEKWLKKK